MYFETEHLQHITYDPYAPHVRCWRRRVKVHDLWCHELWCTKQNSEITGGIKFPCQAEVDDFDNVAFSC